MTGTPTQTLSLTSYQENSWIVAAELNSQLLLRGFCIPPPTHTHPPLNPSIQTMELIALISMWMVFFAAPYKSFALSSPGLISCPTHLSAILSERRRKTSQWDKCRDKAALAVFKSSACWELKSRQSQQKWCNVKVFISINICWSCVGSS